MPSGVVKWFDEDKGYGFICPDGGGKDVFVHAKDIRKSGLASIQEGMRVSFEFRMGKGGREAADQIKVLL